MIGSGSALPKGNHRFNQILSNIRNDFKEIIWLEAPTVSYNFKTSSDLKKLYPLNYKNVRFERIIGFPNITNNSISSALQYYLLKIHNIFENYHSNFFIAEYPHHVSLYSTLKKQNCLCIYDAVEIYSHFPNISNITKYFERSIINKSDIIFSISKYQIKKLEKLKKKIYYIPNGIPKDFINYVPTNNIRPKIGIICTLNKEWIDINLLLRLAKKCSYWDFIIIGTGNSYNYVKHNASNNLKLIGHIDYSKISEMIDQFDVCLIPFRKIELFEYACPLKLFEYLARGKPIVSTDLKEFHYSFLGQIYLSSNKIESWINNIKLALNDSNYTERINFIKNFTWENISKEIVTILDENY
jgi:hypothetical protein